MEKNLSGNRRGAHNVPGSTSGEACIPMENLTPLHKDAEPYYVGEGNHIHGLGPTAEPGFIESEAMNRLGNLDRLTRQELVMAGASALVAAQTAGSHNPIAIISQEIPPSDLLG